MKTNSTATKGEPAAMKCMEIQGGSGSTKNHYTRPGLDIWLSSQSQSCTSAGGSDLYLLSSCASGRITRLLLADVCSYGPDFARTAGDLCELMKAYINSIRQSRFVRQLSHHLADSSSRGCFATMLLSTYFAPTRKLAVCNAGHAPPLLFRADTREWSMLKRTSCVRRLSESPMGVVGPGEYQQFETRLEIGDLVLSCSSILSECLDADGHTIGSEGLLRRVSDFDPDQPVVLATNLANSIRGEHCENLASEDATVILCQAAPNKVPWMDNLLAPFRYLKSVSDKTRISVEYEIGLSCRKCVP